MCYCFVICLFNALLNSSLFKLLVFLPIKDEISIDEIAG